MDTKTFMKKESYQTKRGNQVTISRNFLNNRRQPGTWEWMAIKEQIT